MKTIDELMRWKRPSPGSSIIPNRHQVSFIFTFQLLIAQLWKRKAPN